jgi:[acyl-carrier-protein] S-malonyltransferase
VTAACAAAAQNQICSPANFNSPTQVVIAGNREAIERAVTECQQRGARKAVMLRVSAPFHCALMMPAQTGMTAPLEATTFGDLSVPLINNVDAQLITSGAEARAGLIRQISSPVRWSASVELMLRQGVDRFIEVGPGKVLIGLVKSISKDPALFNVENAETLDSTLDKLSGQAAVNP